MQFNTAGKTVRLHASGGHRLFENINAVSIVIGTTELQRNGVKKIDNAEK